MDHPRIHISYSDRHYHPGRENRPTLWYSCSQIAMHIWQVLSKNYDNISYADQIPDEPIDLLWTNRLVSRLPKVERIIFFASVAHYGFVKNQIKKSLSKKPQFGVEGYYSIKELWRYWLMLERAHRVLVIGNDRILKSFGYQRPVDKGKFRLLNCGIDHTHFQADFSKKTRCQFIYCVTRFSRRKGSHLLAETWKKFERLRPDAHLIVLGRRGDYDLEGELARCRNVDFIGPFESGGRDYLSKLNESRWVIFPSLAEGQAGTLLEAMSCGCVPIASRETGINAEEYGGYVIETGRAEDLAALMVSACGSWTPDQAAKVAEVVQRNHSWKTFQEIILKNTRSLLSMKPGSRDNSWTLFRYFTGFLFNEFRHRSFFVPCL